jgi:predicted Zn-dependent protease
MPARTADRRTPRLATLALLAGVLLAGCADMDDTTRRTVSGAGIGAAGGALIGSLSGDAGWGALIGAGAGAAGGYLYDRSRQNEEEAYRRGLRDARGARR